ncbi:recombination regulator RecX [Nonomuraea antimicrobica]
MRLGTPEDRAEALGPDEGSPADEGTPSETSGSEVSRSEPFASETFASEISASATVASGAFTSGASTPGAVAFEASASGTFAEETPSGTFGGEAPPGALGEEAPSGALADVGRSFFASSPGPGGEKPSRSADDASGRGGAGGRRRAGGADGGRPVEGDHDSLEAQQSVSRERRPSDEWHSEVLAGSSWFAAEPDDGGQQPRSGKGRRSGGSGKRARRSGGKSVRSEEPDSETRPSDRRSGRYDTETSPYGEGVEQHDTGASSYLEGVERHDAGASPYTEGVERHDAGASSYTEEAGWGGAETRSYGETGEGFGDQAGRRGRGAGRFGGGGRKGSRKRGRWPDGPDAESSAGSAPDADPESVARAICLRLLTIAPKTRAQLAEALRKREVPEEAAEAVLSRFSELGLINDEAFAAAWVDSRHHGRGLAKRALAAELRHRGVDGDLVNEAVERLDPDQEEETARRLVERKVSGTRSLDPQTRTRRLAGMLARKGYPSGLAFRVIREALEQEGIEMEDDGFL